MLNNWGPRSCNSGRGPTMGEEERPIETGNSTQRKGKWELEVPLDQLREVERLILKE